MDKLASQQLGALAQVHARLGEAGIAVTVVRRDDNARAKPVEVETAKTGDERGTRMFVPAGSGASRMPTGGVSRNGKKVDPRKVSRSV